MSAAAPALAGCREARDSSALRADGPALRAELARSGYLLLRSLLPTEDLAAARAAFEHARTATSDVPLGRAGAARREVALQQRLCASPAVHALARHPRLLALMSDLLERAEVFVHPRPACRIVPPAADRDAADPTPAHQDHVNMQGTARTYVAWIPLADCPRTRGPLAVAARSHLAGPVPHAPARGARILSCAADGLDWVSADFAPGDVLIFHSLTIHGALANQTGATRISLDCRYQRFDDPVCATSLHADEAFSPAAYEHLPGDLPQYDSRDAGLEIVARDLAYWRADLA